MSNDISFSLSQSDSIKRIQLHFSFKLSFFALIKYKNCSVKNKICTSFLFIFQNIGFLFVSFITFITYPSYSKTLLVLILTLKLYFKDTSMSAYLQGVIGDVVTWLSTLWSSSSSREVRLSRPQPGSRWLGRKSRPLSTLKTWPSN